MPLVGQHRVVVLQAILEAVLTRADLANEVVIAEEAVVSRDSNIGLAEPALVRLPDPGVQEVTKIRDGARSFFLVPPERLPIGGRVRKIGVAIAIWLGPH